MFEAYAALIATELDREHREARTEAALVAERAVSALREQFIAVLGHDLRAPLAAISATVDLMTLQGSATDVGTIAGRIGSSARRMSLMVDDVLDFARGRLGAGIGVRMAWEQDLCRALVEVIAEARAAHPDRVFDARCEVGLPVFCDQTRLQQLLSNLIGNAVFHGATTTPIRVEVRVDHDIVSIAVENAGVQIPQVELDGFFAPYAQQSRSRRGGGLGLGLHICSQIAEAHGGSMSVTSSPEGLTRFEATFPNGSSPQD
jgi:signal transduction histidine kinase